MWSETIGLRARPVSAVIYPDPPSGVITPPPQFSCDTPNHLKFKGGYQGGVYGGYLCDRDGRGNKQ